MWYNHVSLPSPAKFDTCPAVHLKPSTLTVNRHDAPSRTLPTVEGGRRRWGAVEEGGHSYASGCARARACVCQREREQLIYLIGTMNSHNQIFLFVCLENIISHLNTFQAHFNLLQSHLISFYKSLLWTWLQRFAFTTRAFAIVATDVQRKSLTPAWRLRSVLFLLHQCVFLRLSCLISFI